MEWILRSFLLVQIASALSILPQDKTVNQNYRGSAPDDLLILNGLHNTGVQGKPRSSFIKKMLGTDQNTNFVNQLIPVNQPPSAARHAPLVPKPMLQTQRDQEELMKISRDGKPYSELVNQLIPKNKRPSLRDVAAEPKLTPKQMQQAQRDEEELMKLSRDVERSALLGKPYVEKKGRNDFLVIQGASMDPFVTIIPNSIYYDVEKKCVNWLDACSLRGIRSHLLQRVLSPYK